MDTIDVACQRFYICQMGFSHPSCQCEKKFAEDLERTKGDPVLTGRGKLYRHGQLTFLATKRCFCKLPAGNFVRGAGGRCDEQELEKTNQEL